METAHYPSNSLKYTRSVGQKSQQASLDKKPSSQMEDTKLPSNDRLPFSSAHTPFESSRSRSRRSSKVSSSRKIRKGEDIEPVLEVSEDFEVSCYQFWCFYELPQLRPDHHLFFLYGLLTFQSIDDNIRERKSRVSLFYDMGDLRGLNREDMVFGGSRPRRSRSTGTKLPKVMESKEENYAVLKKKILFQHKLKTLVDRSEERLDFKNGSKMNENYSFETFPDCRVIIEDPNEDQEPKKQLRIFSASRTSSMKSSRRNSPMHRSLKLFRVDECVRRSLKSSGCKGTFTSFGSNILVRPLSFLHNSMPSGVLTPQKIDEAEEEYVEQDKPSTIQSLSSRRMRQGRQNMRNIVQGELLVPRDKEILEMIQGSGEVGSQQKPIKSVDIIEEGISSSNNSSSENMRC